MEESGEKKRRTPKDLGIRFLSGTIYVVLFLVLLFLGRISTALFISIVAGIAAFEFFRMMTLDGKQPNSSLGIVAAVLYPFAALVGGQTLMLGFTFVLIASLLIWYVFYPLTRITDVAVTLFGAMYIGLMLSSFVLIRAGIHGYSGGWVALAVFGSAGVCDSLAYLFGSRFGKHKMVPKISPKKSWEGFWAGIIGSVLVWCLVPVVTNGTLNVSYAWAILTGIVCGIVNLLGDLAESRIKRGAGVKDAGSIMPGHGGILDRIDSLILVSFASYLMLKLAGAL